MELRIIRIKMQNFKGVKDREVVLDGKSVSICGANGTGKTTISDAFYFVFCDSNTEMVKNPVITPIGSTECVSSVEIELTIDGKPLTVAKSQKFKTKTDDLGKVTSSTNNTYEINSVAKNQKDFIADLTERGIDMDRFLILSNPNAFMADTSKSGREKIRTTLFEMADDFTDVDIAEEVKAEDVKTLLDKGYRLDEIESMNKATIKKITDSHGKNNELIDKQIQGIIGSKSNADINKLQKSKEEYEKEIDEIDKQIADITSNELKNKVQELKNEIEKKRVEADSKKNKLVQEKNKFHNDIAIVQMSIEQSKAQIDNINNKIASLEEDLDAHRKLYKKVQGEVLDEEDTCCPTCKRPYPEEQIKEIQADFEKGKTKRLKAYKDKAETIKKEIDELKVQIKDLEDHIKAEDVAITTYKHDLLKIEEKISMVDVKLHSETEKLQAEIDNLNHQIAVGNDLKHQELSNRHSYLNQMIKQVEGEIAVYNRNAKLDEQIEQLRKEKKQGEIDKANAEKILDQVDRLKQAKNEKLAESINSHFNIVSFKLWDIQKNGSLIDTVDLMIDGKPASTCANGSLIQLSKLDCINGLQTFFNQHLPVFCEDAALITENTKERIKLDSQLIQLVAADNVSELEVCDG